MAREPYEKSTARDRGALRIKAFLSLSVLSTWTNSGRQKKPVKGKPLERAGRKATGLRLLQLAGYGSRAAGRAHLLWGLCNGARLLRETLWLIPREVSSPIAALPYNYLKSSVD